MNIALTRALAILLVLLFVAEAARSQEPALPAASGAKPDPIRSCQPKPISTPPAEYPKELEDSDITGTVYFAFTIAADGAVKDVRVLPHSRKELVRAALTTVKTWKFEPLHCARTSDDVLHMESWMLFRF